MKIQIFAVGKTKEKWIRDGIDDYLKRLRNIEIIYFKDSVKLNEKIKLKNNEKLIILGEEGKEYSSKEFAHFINKKEYDVCFLIGGPYGIEKEFKKGKDIISLSQMTFTHEMALLFFIEQLYRADTIIKKKSYHKNAKN